MGDHHNYQQDKDTPESIRETLDQGSYHVRGHNPRDSQRGLPPGELLNESLEPEGDEEKTPGEMAREAPLYGTEVSRAHGGASSQGRAKSTGQAKEGSGHRGSKRPH